MVDAEVPERMSSGGARKQQRDKRQATSDTQRPPHSALPAQWRQRRRVGGLQPAARRALVARLPGGDSGVVERERVAPAVAQGAARVAQPLHGAAVLRERPAERVRGAHGRRGGVRAAGQPDSSVRRAVVGLEHGQLHVHVHAVRLEQAALGIHQREVAPRSPWPACGQLELAESDHVLGQGQPGHHAAVAPDREAQVAARGRRPAPAPHSPAGGRGSWRVPSDMPARRRRCGRAEARGCPAGPGRTRGSHPRRGPPTPPAASRSPRRRGPLAARARTTRGRRRPVWACGRASPEASARRRRSGRAPPGRPPARPAGPRSAARALVHGARARARRGSRVVRARAGPGRSRRRHPWGRASVRG